MLNPDVYVTMASASLVGLGMVTVAALSGWRGWLELKREALHRDDEPVAPPSAGTRIEMADLKERIRKLEAIAAGVDL